MKVVINACFGGFSVSKQAAEWMAERGHEHAQKELAECAKNNDFIQAFIKTGEWPAECRGFTRSMLEIDAKYKGEARFYGHFSEVDRHDPLLVGAVEALGEAADGECAKLRVVEVPDGVDYEISEYDGNEHVAEKHRTWS